MAVKCYIQFGWSRKTDMFVDGQRSGWFNPTHDPEPHRVRQQGSCAQWQWTCTRTPHACLSQAASSCSTARHLHHGLPGSHTLSGQLLPALWSLWYAFMVPLYEAFLQENNNSLVKSYYLVLHNGKYLRYNYCICIDILNPKCYSIVLLMFNKIKTINSFYFHMKINAIYVYILLT